MKYPFHLIITNNIQYAANEVAISRAVKTWHNQLQGELLLGTKFRVFSIYDQIRGYRPTSFETMITPHILNDREFHLLKEIEQILARDEAEFISLI